MSSAVDAFPCGSRSTTSTWMPCSARHAARLTAVVVLPTPPFWLAMVITRQDGGCGHSRSVSPSAASAAWAGVTAAIRAGLTGDAGAGPVLTGGPWAGTVTGAWGDPDRSAVAVPSACPLSPPACAGATLPGVGAAETATAAGLPRVLTVPLPCASSRALTSRAFVSRETADSACFIRAGASSRSPARDACPRTCSCPALLALPSPWPPSPWPPSPWPPSPCPPSPWPPTAAPRPLLAPSRLAAAGRPGPCAARGQPSPTAASRDSSLAARSENPAALTGHPRASGEAISARSSQARPAAARPIPVFPGQPRQPAGPVRPTSPTGRQPDDCGSRIDLTAPGEENLRVSHAQPPQCIPRSPDLRIGLGTLDREYDPAGFEQAQRQGRQPVKPRHGARGHHVCGQSPGSLLGPGPPDPGVAQA